MLDSYNPATGKIIGSFEEHSLEDVCAFFETARNEHMPRKKARAMFSTKIALTARLR